MNKNNSEIDLILHENSVEDLKYFIKKRKCLTTCNIFLCYFFHFIHTSGMMITTVAASYNYTEILWIGIGLNALASIISIYEKTNQSISDKMLDNIKHIKEGNYIDESQIVPIDEPENKK